MKHFLISVLFCFTAVFTCFAQTKALSDKAKITILTCGSGDELHAVFGHTAIRVIDPQNQIDVVYNYGTFDFDTSFFYLKFMFGNLKYSLSQSTYEDFIYSYQISNRSVFEQELLIGLSSKQNIYNRLIKDINSESKYYTYQFIDRNCTTKIADILTEYIPKNTIKESLINIDELSYRGIINNYLSAKYYEKLGINLLFGLKTDQQAITIFLPEELMASLTTAQTQQQNISPGAETVYMKSDEEKSDFIWWNNPFVIFGFLLVIILIKKQKADIILIQSIGWIGVFILLFSLISQHKEVSYNINVLVFNPILLLLAYFYRKNNERNFKTTTWVLLAFAIIFIFKMIGYASFYIIAPFIIPIAIVVYRLPFYKTNMNDEELIKNTIG